MRESKAELTTRLRAEGRWDAFKRRREELKATGTAASDAWDLAAAEFPPPSAANVAASKRTLSREELEVLRSKPQMPIIDAIEWVTDHLDCDWVEPSEAPDAESWRLLMYARSSPTARAEFYRQLVMPLWKEAADNEQEWGG